MRILASALAVAAGLASPAAAAAATVTVTLRPSAEVVGRTTTVSFGVPMPPGLLQSVQTVSVSAAGGTAIPIAARSLGTWKSLPPSDVTCAGIPTATAPGIRSVLIQFSYRFTSAAPVLVKVDTAAAPHAPALPEVPVRSTWRVANEGTFLASDNVMEPAVYALLPPNWLACSDLATMQTESGTDGLLSDIDAGQVSFFDAVINTFNPHAAANFLVDYRATDEPWLYDRAQTFYNGYIRTGRLEFLREAHRAVQYYMSRLYKAGQCPGVPDSWCKGFFSLKNPATLYYKDSKYSYNESLATLYWLTGDPEALTHLSDITSATRSELDLTRPIDLPSWTERHSANAFLAPLFEYEVTGDPELVVYIRAGLARLRALQQTPVDGAVNGCFNHYVEFGSVLSFSPWMGSLMAHALLRVYHTLGDAAAPNMIVALAQCTAARGVYRPTVRGAPPYVMPRYIASSRGDPASLDGDPWSDFEHAIDGAYITALGSYFSRDTANRRQLTDVTTALLKTASYDLAVWTRPDGWPANGAPKYVVSPPRKYAWWYKNSGATSWALGRRVTFNPSQ